MSIILAVSVFVGLLIPELARLLSPLLYPSLFFIMLFSLMQIHLGETLQHFKKKRLLLISIIGMQMIALPVIVALSLPLEPDDYDYLKYLLYVVCASSIFGTPAFAKLLRLDGEMALLGVIFSTMLLPITLPFIWLAFFDTQIEIDSGAYFTRLIVFVLLPGLLALTYHRLTLHKTTLKTSWLKIATVLSLSVFAVAIMDGVTDQFLVSPGRVSKLFLLVLLIHFGLYLLTYLVLSPFDKRIAKTAGLLSAYRNLGLLTAVFGPFLPKEFFIFVGLWQIPMYLSPLIMEIALGRRSK